MRTTTYSSTHLLPDPVRDFFVRRCAELGGLVLLLACGALATSLMTWSVQDPSLNHATSAPTRNWLGPAGAISADLVMQLFGLASVILLVPVASWGWRLMTARRLERIGLRKASPTFVPWSKVRSIEGRVILVDVAAAARRQRR